MLSFNFIVSNGSLNNTLPWVRSGIALVVENTIEQPQAMSSTLFQFAYHNPRCS